MRSAQIMNALEEFASTVRTALVTSNAAQDPSSRCLLALSELSLDFPIQNRNKVGFAPKSLESINDLLLELQQLETLTPAELHAFRAIVSEFRRDIAASVRKRGFGATDSDSTLHKAFEKAVKEIGELRISSSIYAGFLRQANILLEKYSSTRVVGRKTSWFVRLFAWFRHQKKMSIGTSLTIPDNSLEVENLKRAIESEISKTAIGGFKYCGAELLPKEFRSAEEQFATAAADAIDFQDVDHPPPKKNQSQDLSYIKVFDYESDARLSGLVWSYEQAGDDAVTLKAVLLDAESAVKTRELERRLISKKDVGTKLEKIVDSVLTLAKIGAGEMLPNGKLAAALSLLGDDKFLPRLERALHSPSSGFGAKFEASTFRNELKDACQSGQKLLEQPVQEFVFFECHEVIRKLDGGLYSLVVAGI